MSVKRREFLKTVGVASSIGFGAAGTAVAQQTPTVEMISKEGSYYFDPIGLRIQPGETVTFKNVSGSHSATAYKKGVGPAQVTRIPDKAEAWDSGVLTSQGATFEHTFEVEGTYDYFCIPHKTLGMVGRVVVGDPGGPAEGSMPPDGKVPTSETIMNQGTVSYRGFTSGKVSGNQGASANGTTGIGQPLIGLGLFGAMTIAAAFVYRFTNSEGERYRVGSAAWKRSKRIR